MALLPRPGHYQDILDAGCDSFFDNVLDGRLIYYRKHFLRLSFVAGRNLGAHPAAGITALRIFNFISPRDRNKNQ